ncbi:MAG: cytochrome P450 [Pseudonocardia sp.]
MASTGTAEGSIWSGPPHLSDITGFWAGPIAERAAAFAALRRQEPVPFLAEPQLHGLPVGPGYYPLTRLDDIVAASRNPEVFTSGQGIGIVDRSPELRDAFGPSIITMDDPRHARLRRIVSQGFTPRRVQVLVGNVERMARTIVDDVIDAGECDAVTAISARLPLKIICDMMGVPDSQYDFVFERTNVLLGPSDPEYVPDQHDAIAAVVRAGRELTELMRELAAHRRAHPADDVTSMLVNARVDGEVLTPEELAGFFNLLVVAGNETTRNASSWGIQLLTEHPDQRAAWLADLDSVTPTAVEEIVRLSSPVIFMRRTLATDTVLGGQPMNTGDKVAMFYWAANRDPAHFHDPDVFDVRRSPNPHIGFGAPGPHFCLGAHLARREIAVMFRELLTRVPDIHATAEPQRLRSMFINGIKHLPVAFTPGPPSDSLVRSSRYSWRLAGR